MRQLTFPVWRTPAHERLPQVLARPPVFARGVVTMAIFQRTRFTLPAVLAVAFKIGDSVHASSVVATGVGAAVVCVYTKGVKRISIMEEKYLLMLHKAPSQPSLQIHWNALILSTQVPPFSQGLTLQSLMSIK